MIVRCRRCGVQHNVAPAHVKRGRGKLCSVKCRKAEWAARPKRMCRECDKSFHAPASQTGKYCSVKCFKKNWTLTYRGGLTLQQVCEIRERYPYRYVRGAQIVKKMAQEYGVKPLAIYMVLEGRSWNGARHNAGVAQRQSNALVMRRLGVQVPSPAPL